MKRRHVVAAVASLGLAIAFAVAMPGHGQTPGWSETFSPRLPALTGTYPVGLRRAGLVDHERSDRELVVDVHYPASTGSSDEPLAHYGLAEYVTEGVAAEWGPDMSDELGLHDRDVNWMFRTRSHEWTPAADGSFPVVLYSPPPGQLRTGATSIVEDLASHGFVVVSIDRPYDSPVVEVPDGEVVDVDDAGAPVPAADPRVREQDIAFVAQHLGLLDDEVVEVADTTRIGVLGWTGHRRALVDAGISAVLRCPAAPSTDAAVIGPQIAHRYPETASEVRRLTGPVPSDLVRTLRSRALGFFDERLKVPAP